MSFCSDATYKKSQKRRMCDWCWMHIEVGERYAKYFWAADDGARGSCTMHPECYNASIKWCENNHETELPIAGTYNRGCYCGNKKQDCQCKEHTENVNVQ